MAGVIRAFRVEPDKVAGVLYLPTKDRTATGATAITKAVLAARPPAIRSLSL